MNWLPIAEKYLGTEEIPGSLHNKDVLYFHSFTSLKATDDETPWCSSFACAVMELAGYKSPRDARAISWKNWGQELDEPHEGCIVVFPHHVGFFVGWEGNRLKVLGGNQSDKVTVTKYDPANVVSYRWPKEEIETPVSTNMEELRVLIWDWADKLDVVDTELAGDPMAPAKLLATIARVESNYGSNVGPRFEATYYKGGKSYARSSVVRQLVDKYDKAAACSYGPFQIMYPTAWDLGFRDAPEKLAELETNIEYAVKYLNKYALCWEGIGVADIADAYNSGCPWDSVIPAAYILKFAQVFNEEAAGWVGKPQGGEPVPPPAPAASAGDILADLKHRVLEALEHLDMAKEALNGITSEA